jgi:hypothetical protein
MGREGRRRVGGAKETRRGGEGERMGGRRGGREKGREDGRE